MDIHAVSWKYPEPRSGITGQWDKFVGPGATTPETVLTLVPSFLALFAIIFYAYFNQLGWDTIQYVVAALIAFDFTGGITANATSSAKRWYHRKGQSFKQHFGFVAAHAFQIFLVAWMFRGLDIIFFLVVYIYLLLAAFVVLKVPLRIQRSIALLFVSGAIVLSIYILSPTPGFEWFIPFLFLKILVSHLTTEEPYI
jgi:hypothetical protein